MSNLATIPIESLTLSEKLLLLEHLWEDLSKHPKIKPPEWHGDVLTARLTAVKEGKTQFVEGGYREGTSTESAQMRIRLLP